MPKNNSIATKALHKTIRSKKNNDFIVNECSTVQTRFTVRAGCREISNVNRRIMKIRINPRIAGTKD